MNIRKKTGSVTIAIPEPCSEDWDQMQPVGCGRFCGQCRKNLLDFSTLSDEQIGRILTQKDSSSICGRFSATQLNRPMILLAPASETPWLSLKRMIAAALLLVPGFTTTALRAQQSQEHRPSWTQQDKATASNSGIIISGRISDIATGDSLAAMEIRVNDQRVQYSDQNGHYTFSLPDTFAGKKITISAAYQPGCAAPAHSIILEESLQINNGTYSYTADLFRYPSMELNKTEIKGAPPIYMGGVVAQHAVRPAKKGPWKRFKALFSQKKNH